MQELLLFCFQQDLDSALMRALNTDNMERAQNIREKLQTIDEAVQEIQAAKGSSGNPNSPSLRQAFSKSVALRASLQEAIVQERYEEAARLRDELKTVQEEADDASSRAELASRKLKEQRQLRLGQRVTHRKLGYRAAVCGCVDPRSFWLSREVVVTLERLLWDAACCESAEWQQEAQVDNLEIGLEQPFYQVLVDVRDGHGEEWQEVGPIVYVAQELLQAPETSWVEEHGEDRFSNPFTSSLFLGQDERGDLLPSRMLREKFGQERRDVFPPDDRTAGGDSQG